MQRFQALRDRVETTRLRAGVVVHQRDPGNFLIEAGKRVPDRMTFQRFQKFAELAPDANELDGD